MMKPVPPESCFWSSSSSELLPLRAVGAEEELERVLPAVAAAEVVVRAAALVGLDDVRRRDRDDGRLDLLGDVREGRQGERGAGRPRARARTAGGGGGRRGLLGRREAREVEAAREDHPEDDRSGEQGGEGENFGFRAHTVHR